MEYFCLRCLHHWESRGTGAPRQCRACWGRAIASREELRLGRVFLRPWAYWAIGQLPPPPSPAEVVLLPACIVSYGAVMGRARSAAERQRAAELMLLEDGFAPAVASERAARLFPQV